MSTLHLCESCGVEADEQALETCALSVPWAPLEHCAECAAECLAHGPCGDEAAKEWRAEHG